MSETAATPSGFPDTKVKQIIEVIVNRAWREQTLHTGSPFYDSPDIPYPDAAEAAESRAA